ncbi:MAG: sulfatase [Planctomycetes bacterium]|nr:sulfatase [Planctomycetota bacterium]MBI3846448.1 sulfatase [Planctomycetota bacterium]
MIHPLRRAIPALGLACILTTNWSCGNEATGKIAPPNVLFILIDALRADHLSSYGYARKTSPHVDALADEGVRFERANCQATWTGSSVASIFSGLYPSTHGVITNPTHTSGQTFASAILAPQVTTLAESMKARGYRTGAIVTNVFLRREYGFDQGFDDYEMLEHREHGAAVNRDALEWIGKKSASPFFLYLHYMDVHGPYTPPAPYDEYFKPEAPKPLPETAVIPPNLKLGDCRDLAVYEARYDGGIRCVDEEIGDLLKKLDGMGLAKNTLVVFTADHGEELYEHGGFGHGRTLYEEVLHTPLVFRLPGRVPAKKSIHTGVSAIDIYPTILELCDAPNPPAMHGRSLVPLIDGKDSAEREIWAEIHLEKGQPQICHKLDTVKSIYTLAAGEVGEYLLLGEDPAEQKNAIGRLSAPEKRVLADAFTDYIDKRKIEAVKWSTSATHQPSPQDVERMKAIGYLPDTGGKPAPNGKEKPPPDPTDHH